MKPIPGWVGWLGLIAYIVAFDSHPRTETLSAWAAPSGTHGRRCALIGLVYLVMHLTRTLPKDPLWAWERRRTL